MTMQFEPTVTNMVSLVRNIVEGYRMGPIRAIAQEPVQNAKDAKNKRVQGPAYVEYRLHHVPSINGGGESWMLTVTDSNTTGLQGPVLSFQDIQARGNSLREDENWAAFEGLGFSREDQDSLGSRGQGKASFLYHSKLPREIVSTSDRMMMLYDTLLPNGEYRLGVRYAQPGDVVQRPPLFGNKAKDVVGTYYDAGDGTVVHLGLAPLDRVGTRVIVPYLSQEAVEAFRSGELQQWLQRCWWRAIQTKDIIISVTTTDGLSKEIAVPPWWVGEPWQTQSKSSPRVIRLRENTLLPSGYRFKRIVLLYDPDLSEADLDSDGPQFWGVQLLRGRQWIETQTSTDNVPPAKRSGFRGFVEFDTSLERELRNMESSQHDRFDGRHTIIKEIRTEIDKEIHQFASEQGWVSQDTTQAAPDHERDVANEFLRFWTPGTRSPQAQARGRTEYGRQQGLEPVDRWECSLGLGFPDPKSTRIDWGQSLQAVTATIKQLPPGALRRVTVTLELSLPEDTTSAIPIRSNDVDVREGLASSGFGTLRLVRGTPRDGDLQCTQAGKWRITARVMVGSTELCKNSRTLFVQEDPPPPPSRKPYTVSISAENHSIPGSRRINHGNQLGIQISVTNRTPHDVRLALTGSIGHLLLADNTLVTAPGTPAGETPIRTNGLTKAITVNRPGSVDPTESSEPCVELEPGRHDLRCDLRIAGTEDVVAHGSKRIDVEVDPIQHSSWPPFEIEQLDGGPHPRWQFLKQPTGSWVLQYPRSYPTYRALASGNSSGGQRLAGRSAFVAEICSEALIEWALDPLGNGDRSLLDEILDSPPTGSDPNLWERCRDAWEELVALRDNPDSPDIYGQKVRACVSRMLNLYEVHG